MGEGPGYCGMCGVESGGVKCKACGRERCSICVEGECMECGKPICGGSKGFCRGCSAGGVCG